MFEIKSLKLGHMDNFVYLIKDQKTAKIAVVDPAWDVDAIFAEAAKMEGEIDTVLLTHSHYDHVNGVDQVLHRSDASLHLHKTEDRFWGGAGRNACLHHGGDRLQLGETELIIHHTPGHTPGSVCYQVGDNLLTGDTVFVFGCGRCNMRGGDPEAMYHTLKKIGSHFDPSTRVLPGHDYAICADSTVGAQLQGNPFFKIPTLNKFIDYRMHKHNRSSPYSALNDIEF